MLYEVITHAGTLAGLQVAHHLTGDGPVALDLADLFHLHLLELAALFVELERPYHQRIVRIDPQLLLAVAGLLDHPIVADGGLQVDNGTALPALLAQGTIVELLRPQPLQIGVAELAADEAATLVAGGQALALAQCRQVEIDVSYNFV